MSNATCISCDYVSLQRDYRVSFERRRSIARLSLLTALVLLQIIDVWTSRAVLAGGGWEANPMMAWTMTHFAAWWFAPQLALMAASAFVVTR